MPLPQSMQKKRPRWYPWGIERLVSTYSNRQNSKCHDLPIFQFGEGGVLGKVRFGLRKNNCLEFWAVFWERSDLDLKENWSFELGGVLPSQNSKCQDLPNFQFQGVGGVVFWTKF